MLKVAALENVGVLSARLAQAIDEDPQKRPPTHPHLPLTQLRIICVMSTLILGCSRGSGSAVVDAAEVLPVDADAGEFVSRPMGGRRQDVLQLEAILVSTRLLDERASQALGAMRKLAAESEMAEAQEQARAELGW